jgi:hypothetical protein
LTRPVESLAEAELLGLRWVGSTSPGGGASRRPGGSCSTWTRGGCCWLLPRTALSLVRQVFSGREVARIERPWAPSRWLGEVVTALRFDPDGRLSFTWLRAASGRR